MAIQVKANDATAAKRSVYFLCVDATDGLTTETGENGGQPQISTNNGAYTNTGIGTLATLGTGWYYATLTQTAVATAGDLIRTRYKSANTAETPGDTVQVVGFDPTTDLSAAVVTAWLAKTGWTTGGATTIQTALRALYAMAHNKVTVSGNSLAVLDDDGTTTLFTLTLADSGRTVV